MTVSVAATRSLLDSGKISMLIYLNDLAVPSDWEECGDECRDEFRDIRPVYRATDPIPEFFGFLLFIDHPDPELRKVVGASRFTVRAEGREGTPEVWQGDSWEVARALIAGARSMRPEHAWVYRIINPIIRR